MDSATQKIDPLILTALFLCPKLNGFPFYWEKKLNPSFWRLTRPTSDFMSCFFFPLTWCLNTFPHSLCSSSGTFALALPLTRTFFHHIHMAHFKSLLKHLLGLSSSLTTLFKREEKKEHPLSSHTQCFLSLSSLLHLPTPNTLFFFLTCLLILTPLTPNISSVRVGTFSCFLTVYS